ncbi:hypothetical protein [Caproicibacter fermentans]|uniref:Uncharacterized protein n=1 Tax=Caproicibacter fermentans TaxID=2576756 RepID=A0A7G8T9Q3_9FIRM|nr:hypothetical protein [Caproicibacter fermentans]QNK40344.1 hypothetical protein HCR03_17020 [Caproicibacter fermentans]
MNQAKRKKISMRLLQLAASVFGFATLAELGAAGIPAVRQMNFLRGPAAMIGGADVPTAIYVTSQSPLAMLAPLAFALPPVFTAATLFLLHLRKKGKTDES